MRTIFSVAMVAGWMLLGAAGSCLALQENMELTRQQAEQEFGLKMTDGGKRVVPAALATTKGEGETLTVAFGTDPALTAPRRVTKGSGVKKQFHSN